MRGLGALPGVVSGCIFEIQTSRVMAHLGARGPAVELARRGTTLLAAAGIALTLAACGHNVEQRAATGAAAGAVVGGPVGAVVGGAAGTVVSKAADK